MMCILLLVLFGVLMAIGTPIGVAMGIGTVAAVIIGDQYNVLTVIHRAISGAESYTMLAVPFFMLAGQLMNTGGITRKIFKFAQYLVGWIPGGLAHANVLASIIFSGMSGSAVADVGGLGQIEIDAMTEEGYDLEFSAAVTAASATIGPIIPPSIPMVVYAVIAEASVGTLFMGGFIPGLLMGLAMMILIYFMSKKRGYPRVPFIPKVAFRAWLDAFFPLLTPIIIIGGMFGGAFSPTEASAVAVVYAAVLGFVTRELTVKDFINSVIEAGKTSGTVVLIVCFSVSFAWLFAVEGFPQLVVDTTLSITTNPYLILLALNIVFLFIGMFMPTVPTLTIVVPFIVPLISTVGFNTVHIGVMLVLNLMVGMCTPPVGLSLFVCSKVSGVPLQDMFRAILPFLIPLMTVLLLVTYFPDLVLWLPRTLGYN